MHNFLSKIVTIEEPGRKSLVRNIIAQENWQRPMYLQII